MKSTKVKAFFVILAVFLIFLNFLTLLNALPATSGSYISCNKSTGCIRYSRDFSAYYQAALRLINNPSSVYQKANNLTGSYHASPSPQNYRYSPYFLLFMIPFLAFDYQTALVALDAIQFALLVPIAFLLFKILSQLSSIEIGPGSPTRSNHGTRHSRFVAQLPLLLSTFVFVCALLQPFPYSKATYEFWSWSYFWVWAEGQPRVLQTFFLVLSFYLILRRSRFSGVALALSSFDPRITLMALPLAAYLAWKVKSLRKTVISSVVSIFVLYLPAFAYANLGIQFLQSVFEFDPFNLFVYVWVPILTIASLSVYALYMELARRRIVTNEAKSKHIGASPEIVEWKM